MEHLELSFRNLVPELRGLETHSSEKRRDVLPGRQGDEAEQRVALFRTFDRLGATMCGNLGWQKKIKINIMIYAGNSDAGNL